MAYSQEMKDKFKDRLKKILSKKIETTMIYSLSQVETIFGHLFGHGKELDKLTDEEKVNYEKWKQCRNNILNLGNQQKRNLNAEIDQYEVLWNRYRAIFVPTCKEQQ